MNVLMAVDLSESAGPFLEQAVALLGGALGRVWLLHVAEPEPDFVGFEIDSAVMRGQVAEGFHREHRQLQALAEGLREQGVDATALLVRGETVKTIAEQAKKLGADLIVVGAHKGGALRRLLSAEADWGGVAASGTPVLLMPAG